MAKVQNTLIGRASGSVGGATFTTWKGINVLKSKPESVANPRSLGQISQRNRLSVMVPVYRALALIVAIGFKSRAIAKSAYNAFMSSNIIPATSVDGSGNATILFPNLKFALGTMGSIPISAFSPDTGNDEANVDWDGSLAPIGSNPLDLANIVVYNSNTGEWVTSTDEQRNASGVTVAFLDGLSTGDVLHAYLFFKSNDSDDVSDSVYATATAS